MKKIFLILLMSASLFSEAQYFTSSTKDASTCDGVVYFLPRNVLKVELTVQETDYYVGPYAEYAKSVFGTDDYISENKTKYEIQGVDVQVFSQPDPDASYCVWLDEKSKEHGTLEFSMTDDGVIRSFGDKISTEGSDISYMAANQYVELSKTDRSEVHFMNFIGAQHEPEENEDEEVSAKELTKEDKAKQIVENINNIRNLYRDLVSGFQEVSYGNTLNDMAVKTKNIENEYVSLFVGKEEIYTHKKAFYITPEAKDKNGMVIIAKISENEGVVNASSKNGTAIKIQFETAEPIVACNTKVDTDGENPIINNKLFYRIPASSSTKIYCGNDVLAECNLKISQFGKTMTVPINGCGILFNPNTGQVVRIKK
ncbi:MAG: DUF4831 family protein [Bacteroidales bacterium]|nr:DUF4831 family protein [Bacteroidales bacterium]